MAFWGDTGGFMDELDGDEGVDGIEGGGGTASWEVGRDALIFLIDATESMFIKTEDSNEDEGTDTPFKKCLKCAHNVLMSKIISSEKDLLGIVFFGTREQKNSSDFENVYNYQDLDMPDANRILQLEDMEKTETLDRFDEEYGHSSAYTLSDALWACSNMFANSSYKVSQKRILLFTVNDDPHANNRDLKNRAIRKAKDLSDLGIDIQLIHMKSAQNRFDVSKFYRDILDEEDSAALPDPADKLDELLTQVRMKEFKKRALCSLPFKLTDGLSLGVSLYSLNRPAVKGSYVKVDSRTNEEVKCITKYICKDTGQELLPTDIKLYQEFGGAKVIFEKEEVAQMKGLVEPGIHLIGFKPMKYLKTYYHVKNSTFLYPDESTVVGSRTLFAALLKRCAQRKVTPICVVARTSSAPRFAALVPQEEEIDEHGVQLKPPGFHMVYLPYCDDIRKVKIDDHPKASNEQIDKMKDIIDKLKFKFTPDAFENPAVQKFYRCLEAFALDRDEVEEVQDLTMPDMQRIDRKAGMVMNEFKELVFPKDYETSSKPSGKRAASGSSSGGGASKKTKTSDEKVEVDIHEAAKKGNLNKLTVAILKAFCQEHKLKAKSMKKADLIHAINEHFSIE